MPRKHTPIRDLFVNTETTRSEGSNAKVWACSRCGWELVDNATRFARHITRCPSATDADRAVAKEHLAHMAPEQIQAINDNAEFIRAFSLGGKAHVRNLFEDTNTTRAGEKAKLFRCLRCGHETTENATRFAQHILKCDEATDEDRSVASEHEALTEKRRQMRKAKQMHQDPREGPQQDNSEEPCHHHVLKHESVLPEVSWEDKDVASGDSSFALRDLHLPAAEHLPEQAMPAPPPPSALAHTPIELTQGTSADFANMLGTLLEEPRGISSRGTSGPEAAVGPPPLGTLESPFMNFGGEAPRGIPELVQPRHGSSGLSAAGLASGSGLDAFVDLLQDGLPGLPQQQQQQQPCVPELDGGLRGLSQGLEDMVRGLNELHGLQQEQQQQQQPDHRGGGGGIVLGALQPMDLGQIASEGNPAALRMRSSVTGSCNMSIGGSGEGMGLGMMPSHDNNSGGEAAGLEVVQCIQQKRRRADEGKLQVVGFAEGEATSGEWQEFLAWKEARAARQQAKQQMQIPRAVATNSMLFQQLSAHFVGHAKECTSIYNASIKAYGPPGCRALVGAQLRSRFKNMMGVQRTLMSCCHMELFRWMHERVQRDPGMFLDLYNATYSCSKEIVAVGTMQMIARRAPLVATMDEIEKAVYNSLNRSFELLSVTEDESLKNKNLGVMEELHKLTVENGPDMRNLMISLVTSSARNQRMTSSDDVSWRSDADSGSSGGCSMDSGHQDEHLVALWQRLVHDALPFVEELSSNDEAALATTAWTSEICEVVGWENALAIFC